MVGVALGLGEGLAELPAVGDADGLAMGLAASRLDRAVRLWPPEPAPAGPSAVPDELADADAVGDGLAFAEVLGDGLADALGEADALGVGAGVL